VPAFPLSEKINVNGPNTHPLYGFLKRSCPSTRTHHPDKETLFDWKDFHDRDVKWNFEKFLIEPGTGRPYKRYDPSFVPDMADMGSDIDFLMTKIPPKGRSEPKPSLNQTLPRITYNPHDFSQP